MSFWRVFSSTIAAFFGVQTEQNRQKDFQSQSPLPFIIMGIILAIGLVISLILIVNQILG
ncbi:DUF2970 domain-containing protein [Shewanella algicola]|uniref:DUF2970 domain-containing protein n=1 Tax=Shewanella algicola TaxID=640633 RepID=A0A9X1ZFI1_9GAMM|nr:DUF2970 domain-containing protein [Shewanella algicola]MCL1106003.1 DUF2970 domain-containing protein [Shewanella algicola]GGP56982.1 DUF2970 domain-containing protein [Shewanella algicola]